LDILILFDEIFCPGELLEIYLPASGQIFATKRRGLSRHARALIKKCLADMENSHKNIFN
ncbi:hypothetical protein, partial [Escherichia fergusonii]|uniref:hypothetical protein n=1 Tax=Escherichia fergusonii TaxID=564 RepID=UPI0013000BF3